MRLLFLGDIVGKSGRRAVTRYVPQLRDSLSLDMVIANAENMAGGFGITPATCEEIFDAGVDVITLGNHSFDNPMGLKSIESDTRILRPVNYPPGTVPGRGAGIYEINGARVLVINVLGRIFMDALDDPFVAIDKELNAAPLGDICDVCIVDMHAEATSEKVAMGHFCDGRASLVVGTHQHVPTADTRILEGGTAYQSDAGMCGDYNSVIGMDKEEPLYRFTTRLRKGRYNPATGEGTLCGIFVETDPQSGLAVRAEPVRMGTLLIENRPVS